MIYLGTITNAGSDVKNNLASGKAWLALATQALGHLDTVVQAQTAGTAGNSVTVEAVGDSAPAAGVEVDEVGSAVTIHYEDGVSTVADVEAAIASDSALLEDKTAGTGATVLAQATDDFTPVPLHDGTAAVTPFNVPQGCTKLRLVPSAATMMAALGHVDENFAPAASAMFKLGAADSNNDFDIGQGRTLAIRKTDSGAGTTKVFGV